MAVYKATLCYPFLNAIDIRTAQYKDYTSQPVQFLTCKIDSSNTKITGYKIRILSSDNQQVFPANNAAGSISPISELQLASLGYDSEALTINSGLNGTTLRIPFFQNNENKVLSSKNAVYYKASFLADHIIASPAETGLESKMDNIQYWDYDSTTYFLTYTWPDVSPEVKKNNDIVLDGESILTGEIVLVLGNKNGVDISGVYEVGGILNPTTMDMTTILTKKTNLTTVGKETTVTKGKTLANYTYTINGDGTFQKSSVGSTWVDVDNTPVPLLDSNNSTYKWEITLYQGNPDATSTSSELTYSDLSPEFLDITIGSGKILGSTPNRIQVASADDDNNGPIYIPAGLDNAPIVLQGKYIELHNGASDSIFSGGTRTYIKTYDSVYGHVYPRTDVLTTADLDSVDHCQFFKYSSNPSEILNTDMVNFCFMDNITLTGYTISTEEEVSQRQWNSWTIDASDNNVNISNRYIAIDDSVATYSSLIRDGDLILLAKQTNAYQNGVYQINKISALPEDPETHQKTTHWCLKRVTGYNTWADYLGKIIYCQNGTTGLRSINMQSLAAAGGTLWDINNATSGTSLLYFTQERPVLLFPQKLKNTFNLYNESVASTAHTDHKYNGTTVDGTIVSQGDIILFNDAKIATVLSIDNTGYTTNTPTALTESGCYYITSGEKYKELVLAINLTTTPASIDVSWELHTAVILKNTPEKTFISPWKTLQTNMKLALLNNKYVSFAKTTSSPYTYKDPTRWITVTGFNDTVFYIKHNKLTIDPTNTSSLVPLQSYIKNDTAVPWSYDIRSFFKTSDENPFYSYQTPYISLKKNNETYSDLHIVGGSFFFYVRPQYSEPASLEFLVYNQEGGTKNLLTIDYKAQAIVTGRSVKLEGLYNGLGQSSWESYQWTLYNMDGEIVQDTGKRYDKDMSVVFFGLSNDLAEQTLYRAILQIENNFGDIITYELDLEINPGITSAFLTDGGVFSVQYDCSTQSNIVHYRESGAIGDEEDNVYLYSIYRREYDILENPKPKLYCYYNAEDSLCYYHKTGSEYSDPVAPTAKYLCIDKDTTHTYTYVPEAGVFKITEGFRTFKGQWQPVLISSKQQWFRDFNISNDRSYEYIVYPTTSKTLEYGLDTTEQTFANYDGKIWRTKDNFRVVQDNTYAGYLTKGTYETSTATGAPVRTHWECWSIAELIPEEINIDAPVVRKQYKIDNSNIWLLKYSLETGSQMQNISKDEFSTLGRFSKFGFGDKNYESGSVSAFLGSELVLTSKVAYTERLGKSRIIPLSSNERSKMLDKWNDFCYSKNPKLLKDIKGRSWIVQVVSNSTTPQNLTPTTPDTVSFEWKQIDTVDNIIIYGDYSASDKEIKATLGDSQWTSPYTRVNSIPYFINRP